MLFEDVSAEVAFCFLASVLAIGGCALLWLRLLQEELPITPAPKSQTPTEESMWGWMVPLEEEMQNMPSRKSPDHVV